MQYNHDRLIIGKRRPKKYSLQFATERRQRQCIPYGRVQNAVARTVMTTSKREHITPVLAELHRLPVAARIDVKIAVITFNLLIADNYLRTAPVASTVAIT